MARYWPTNEEIRALKEAGWSINCGGWWFHSEGGDYGAWTYLEARREQDRRERSAVKRGEAERRRESP
jgi:hypothetical protein